MIRLKDLTKSYGSKKILDGITVDFAAAQTHILLGESGCGKTTLLRLVMGLVVPDSGTIEIDETRLTIQNQKEVARSIGYVLQDGGLFAHLNGRQNVALAAKLQNWSIERIGDRIAELSKLVGLEEGILSRYPKELSGGQRQRIGLMRGLMLDPKILLLDEPLGALDPIVRHHLQNELKEIFNSLKKTVLIVTHDLGEAAFFGHSITLMREGRVEQTGNFRDLAQSPATPFVKEFLNAQRPPEWMNMLT